MSDITLAIQISASEAVTTVNNLAAALERLKQPGVDALNAAKSVGAALKRRAASRAALAAAAFCSAPFWASFASRRADSALSRASRSSWFLPASSEAARRAEANRAKFGRSKAEKGRDAAEQAASQIPDEDGRQQAAEHGVREHLQDFHGILFTRLPPHSNGEVSASYADGGVIGCGSRQMPPPSRYDRDTSPSEWRGQPV